MMDGRHQGLCANGLAGNITGRNVVSGTQWITRTYYYSDSAHTHAVTGLANGWEFGHDLNGNMTGRVDSGSYTQAFDVENRLIAVTDTQTLSVTRFVYDGDGNRVMTVYPDGSQTAFVGDHYEVEGSTARSYYFFGSQRVAMRVDDGASEEVYWFHTDHLGSTSLLSTISGTLVPSSTVRYLPYGEPRVGAVEQLPTDHGYTGQRWGGSVGLYDYRARWYHPAVGRFISVDTMIPDLQDPQAFNRYSYVRNGPINRTDPTGHRYDREGDKPGGIDGATCGGDLCGNVAGMTVSDEGRKFVEGGAIIMLGVPTVGPLVMANPESARRMGAGALAIAGDFVGTIVSNLVDAEAGDSLLEGLSVQGLVGDFVAGAMFGVSPGTSSSNPVVRWFFGSVVPGFLQDSAQAGIEGVLGGEFDSVGEFFTETGSNGLLGALGGGIGGVVEERIAPLFARAFSEAGEAIGRVVVSLATGAAKAIGVN